jgi:ribosomal protein L29
MKVEEIRALAVDEIEAKVTKSKQQVFEMRMQHYGQPGSVKSSELRKARKMVARLITVLTEKISKK